MTTALATTTNNLPSHTHLGDRNEIAAVRSRLASMMQLPADVPDDVIWAAAQLAVAHRLNPFTGEIYIIELGAKKNDATGTWVKQYRAHVGVKGLRTIARRQANFTMKMAVMNPDEVQRYRRDLYHPDDIGVRCTLWRLDVARECKDAGVPYEPVIGVGFWRHQSQQRRGEWVADNIPNTWTAQQVAEKRAEINAIKLAYDLALDIADPGATGEEDVINVIGHQMDAHDADTALPLPRQLQVEDDGDILFDVEPPRRTVDAATGEILPAPTLAPRSAPENGISADVDLGMGESSDNPFDGDTPAANDPQEAERQTLLRKLHAIGHDLYGDKWDSVRHKNVRRFTGQRTESSKEMTVDELGAMIAGMEQLQAKRAAQPVAA